MPILSLSPNTFFAFFIFDWEKKILIIKRQGYGIIIVTSHTNALVRDFVVLVHLKIIHTYLINNMQTYQSCTRLCTMDPTGSSFQAPPTWSASLNIQYLDLQKYHHQCRPMLSPATRVTNGYRLGLAIGQIVSGLPYPTPNGMH